MNDTLELWLPVVGYEGHYEVSSHGNVRSLDRKILGPGSRGKERVVHSRKGRLKKLSNDRDGYKLVSLCMGGKESQHRVHRMVMLAFAGPEPSWATEVNHLDGNPANNHLSNLEWQTASGNQRHALRRAKYEYNGKMYSMIELAELSEVPYLVVRNRIKYLGWTIERALATAPRVLPSRSSGPRQAT
jgi:hypothetical protein